MDKGNGLQLGYLVLGVSRREPWHEFLDGMLGLAPAPAGAGGTAGVDGWRMDGAVHRIVLEDDEGDDLRALGLDTGSEAGLAGRVMRLREMGVDVHRAPADMRLQRRVADLYLARDPAGVALELFHGLETADPVASPAVPGGFVTGELGLGHAVLVSRDIESLERFYTQFGFGVTERLDTRVGPIHVRGTFLHCNRRHHTLALFDVPSRKRLHHFMLQARDAMDVGRAFERARERKVPLSLGIGQHPDPDGTFSFYGTTPSGFDFEIGSGSGLIEPQGWAPVATSTTSAWGHEPRLRLKLRAARDMLLKRAL